MAGTCTIGEHLWFESPKGRYCAKCDPERGVIPKAVMDAITCPYCDSENVTNCGEISDTQDHYECVGCRQGFPVKREES